MKYGVVVFPGSNCDHDMLHVLSEVVGAEVLPVWHKQRDLTSFSTSDCIVLPGGFSFGDYLRAGAIARFSPFMNTVIEFANSGGCVLGICNGFQILCEAKLLPGVLLPNASQKFTCRNIHLKVENPDTPLTQGLEKGKIHTIPIAHADGRYFADDRTIDHLFQDGQVMFTYCDKNGNPTEDANPNGSVRNIAGICNKNRNVFGMMPHPERAAERELGNTDGLAFFESLAQHFQSKAAMLK